MKKKQRILTTKPARPMTSRECARVIGYVVGGLAEMNVRLGTEENNEGILGFLRWRHHAHVTGELKELRWSLAERPDLAMLAACVNGLLFDHPEAAGKALEFWCGDDAQQHIREASTDAAKLSLDAAANLLLGHNNKTGQA